jgi:hypothetical protein
MKWPIFSIACVLVASQAQAQQLAFPGAEGFGRFAAGGRGGTVYRVTNLNDTGAGSLRDCIEATGARTCVFDVGGDWVSETALTVTNSNLTIAGETAPPPGVTLKLIPAPDTDPLIITASDVIVRFIAVENGRRSPGSSATRDGLSVTKDAADVILDHVSVRYGIDETLELEGCNVTVQNSIVAWGLEDAGHDDGNHSKGVLAQGGGTQGPHPVDCSVTLFRVLVAHANDRLPEIWGSYDFVQVSNLLAYNPDQSFFELKQSDDDDDFFLDIISSACIAGPDTIGTIPTCLDLRGSTEVLDPCPPISLYYSDLLLSSGVSEYDSTDGAPTEANPCRINGVVPSEWIRATPDGSMPTISSVIPAADMYTEMLPYIGRTLPLRPIVDQLVVNNVLEGTGSIINSAAPIVPTVLFNNALNALLASCPCDWRSVDTDGDGMPNTYERANGFDPFDDADGVEDEDADGYDNFEEYLHYRASLAPSAS